eukprot:1364640-Pyramimonas_sp.AAC.1
MQTPAEQTVAQVPKDVPSLTHKGMHAEAPLHTCNLEPSTMAEPLPLECAGVPRNFLAFQSLVS